MAEEITYYQGLLARYLEGSATEDEAVELFAFIANKPRDAEQLLAGAGGIDYIRRIHAMGPLDPVTGDRMEERLLAAIREETPVRLLHQRQGWTPRKWAVAASIALLLGAGGYVWITGRQQAPFVAAKLTAPENDVTPGGNKAVLTLAGGEKIVLDSASNGLLAAQGNAQVLKLSNGQLAYNALHGKPSGASEVIYNTLTTPRGGQYQLTLPDGTKVWLNAASSITYPTTFGGRERVVVMTGEAYFAVVHNPRVPFRVRAGASIVEDVGTQFNINAYPDEKAIQTTLVEGSVRVTGATERKVLTAGEQAQLDTGGTLKVLTHADVQQAIAWKNGLFNFDHADLQTVMRQISRWYDVEIVYEGAVPQQHFLGEIQRELNLSDVLDALKRSDVHFKIEGKKLIVLP